jgi:hypothetical protein
MREREAVRLIPRQAIAVEIDSFDISDITGVVANISDLGACVWTRASFDTGDVLVMRLHFGGEQTPFQAAGRVVWSDSTGNTEGLRRCGLRWAHTTGPQHERLKTLIGNC